MPDFELPTYPYELGFDRERIPSWRPRQAEVTESILNSDKKLVILVVPTGGGKSTIALAAGRMLAREGHKTTVLTHQKSLQRQYLDYTFDSDPQVLVATGKSNHMCIADGHTDLTAAEAPCSHGGKCQLRVPVVHGVSSTILCPYYKQLAMADDSLLRCLNYPIFIEIARRGPDKNKDFDSRFNFQELLVCDEGHRTDKAILDAVSTTVTVKDQIFLHDHFDIRMPKIDNQSLRHSQAVIDWAKSTQFKVIQEIDNYERLKKEVPKDLMKMFFKMAKVGQLVDKSAVINYDQNGALQFRPVLSEEFAKPLLLNHAEKTVLLSATIIGGPEYWAGRMGLDPSEAEYIELPSSFPVENRPIFFWPVVQMNNDIWNRPDDLRKLMDAIDQIIIGYMPYKGLIHTANKRLAYYIRDNSKFRELMFVGGGEILDDFKAADVGVMVSYSATEGVDLPDDLCRYTIFAKVPWLPKNDPVIQVQMEEIPGFYDYEAASAIVQGVGRGMRHENDWSVNFILDKSFRMLHGKTKANLPAWFNEALSTVSAPPMPAQAVA